MGANDYWLSWPSVMKDMQKVGWKHSETHIGPSEASEVVDLAACHPKDLTVQRVMVHLSFHWSLFYRHLGMLFLSTAPLDFSTKSSFVLGA